MIARNEVFFGTRRFGAGWIPCILRIRGAVGESKVWISLEAFRWRQELGWF